MIVFDGKFDESANSVLTEQISNIEMRDPVNRTTIGQETWERIQAGSKFWRARQEAAGLLGGTNLRCTSSFEISPVSEGSYVVGITLRESRIAMDGFAYVGYLNNEAFSTEEFTATLHDDPKVVIRERYTKTAKTIIQVGDTMSTEATEPLGLLVEIVPLMNPAMIKKGDVAEFKILEDGEPFSTSPLSLAEIWVRSDTVWIHR